MKYILTEEELQKVKDDAKWYCIQNFCKDLLESGNGRFMLAPSCGEDIREVVRIVQKKKGIKGENK